MDAIEPEIESTPKVKKSWYKRKRFIIPISLLFLSAVAGEASAIRLNSEFKDFEALIENAIQRDELDTARAQILSETSKFETCAAILFCGYQDGFTLLETKVNALAASKSKFDQAENFLANEDYELAIRSYQEVSELDEVRSKKATTQIVYAEAQLNQKNAALLANAIKNAKNLSAKGKHIDALAELDSVRNLAKQSNDYETLRIDISAKADAEKQRIEAAKNAQYVNALRSMRKQTDEFNGITFYEDSSTPRYANYSTFHLYIGKGKNSSPYLRFKVRYSNDDWLFVDSASINVDGEIYDLNISSSEWERDNGSGDIWEWVDIVPTQFHLSMIDNIIKSKSAVIRYYGSQYRDDRTITTTQKRALANVLNAYQALDKGLD